MFPEDKNKIEELKKTLYSRENYKPDNPVHVLPRKTYEVNNAWTKPAEPLKKGRRHWPLAKILIWFSILFFFVAAGIAAFVYYNGYNTISADNVDISITGPTTIDAGRDTTFAIAIDNKNQIDLQDTYLVIEYPDGARRDSTKTEPLVLDRISLGTVASGTHLDRTISSVFFGLQGTAEKVKITLEYHVLGSTSLFAKNKDYLFALGAGPVSMVVSHVSQVNSGQDVTFTVAVTSNSAVTLSNLALNASYPFGFTFKNAIPGASLDNAVWQLGDIAPGEKKIVTIVGKLEGQENEDRAFKFNVGISNPADSRKIATVFYTGTETVKIQKPFIGLVMDMGTNSSEPYPIYAGDAITAKLSYNNNMSTSLTDATIKVKLDGAILDKNSVLPVGGFYQSSDNTITWDKRSVPALAFLGPGDAGNVLFTFKALPFSAGASYTKSSQKISIGSNVTATEATASGAVTVSSSIARSTVVNSNIVIMAKVLYNGTVFKNTGLVPLKAEKATTLTINWAISNTFNNTSNVTVAAVLPSYVKFLNNVSPQNEDLTYNPISGEVNWNVGNIKTNTGYSTAPRQVSFQISFSPSLTQIGSVPTILGESVLKATDTFTNSALSARANYLTTDMASDPKYKFGQGVIIK